MTVPFCDDCGHGCRQQCVYIQNDEQPIFQAYRLATRLLPDEPWRTWEFMAWVGSKWSAFDAATGGTAATRPRRRDQFRAWLFVEVGHPRAGTEWRAAA